MSEKIPRMWVTDVCLYITMGAHVTRIVKVLEHYVSLQEKGEWKNLYITINEGNFRVPVLVGERLETDAEYTHRLQNI